MAALEQHLARWATIRLSCAPADRETAEHGIRLSYETAGLAPPRRIIWCGGPLEIAKRLAAVSTTDQTGASVKARIFDAPQDRVGAFAEIFWNEIVIAAREVSNRSSIGSALNSIERAERVSSTINRVVREATYDVLFRTSVRVRHAVQRWRGLPRILPHAQFSDVAIGPDELASLGVQCA